MAHDSHSSAGAPLEAGVFDMAEHETTYRAVLALFKWGTIALVILMIFLFMTAFT